MMNTTTLTQTDGGTQIKQGDVSSRFAYELCDEYNQAIDLNGKEATIKLLSHANRKKWQTKATVEDNQVSFHLDIIPVGVYEVEILCDGYIFPSDHKTIIRVEKSDETYTSEQVAKLEKVNIQDEVKRYVDSLGLSGVDDERINDAIKKALPDATEEALESVKKEIAELQAREDKDTIFDPSSIHEELEALGNRLTGLHNYNDTEVRSLIKSLQYDLDQLSKKTDQDTIYDDSELKAQLETLKGQVSVLEGRPIGSDYDDTTLKQELSTLSTSINSYNERIERLENKEDNSASYDDTALKERLEALENRADKDTVYDDTALKTEINQHLDQTDKAIESLVNTKANKSDLDKYQLKDEAPSIDLSGLATKQDLASKADASLVPPLEERISSLEAREDKDTVYDDNELRERVTALENKPSEKVDTSNLVTKEELEATKQSVQSLANTKADKSAIPDVSNFATKSELPNLDGYALKSDLAKIGTGSSGGSVDTSTLVTKAEFGEVAKDTGWLKMTSTNLTDGYIAIRRIGRTCYITLAGGTWGTFSTQKEGSFKNPDGVTSTKDKLQITGQGQLPTGFRTPMATMSAVFRDNGEFFGMFLLTSTTDQSIVGVRGPGKFASNADTRFLRMPIVSYVTTDPFPDNLNGLTKL